MSCDCVLSFSVPQPGPIGRTDGYGSVLVLLVCSLVATERSACGRNALCRPPYFRSPCARTGRARSFAPLCGSTVPGPSSALDVTGGVDALPAGRPSTLRRARSRACTPHPRSPCSLYHDATARTGEGCRPACAACLRFNSCPDTGGGAGASRSHARGASSLAPWLPRQAFNGRTWRAAGWKLEWR